MQILGGVGLLARMLALLCILGANTINGYEETVSAPASPLDGAPTMAPYKYYPQTAPPDFTFDDRLANPTPPNPIVSHN